MTKKRHDAGIVGVPVEGLPDPLRAERAPADFILDPRTTLLFLLGVIAFLLLADAVIGVVPYFLGHPSYTVGQLYLRVDLDGEGNLPSYFSALVLLACAGLSAWIARDETLSRGRWAWHWRLVAAGFAYLSIDEAAQLHELLNMPVRYVLEDWKTHAAWTLVALIVLGIALLFLASFLRAMPARLRRMLLIAGAVYVCGAVGVEIIGGAVGLVLTGRAAGVEIIGGNLHIATVIYEISVTIEEGLEMTGAALFVFALLTRLADMKSTVIVRAEHARGR